MNNNNTNYKYALFKSIIEALFQKKKKISEKNSVTNIQ
uniref:Uncharacterized protein n=1 Tax=Onchocerca volvulus TaxID=6282 RepID=A0A8R1Y4G5_ONCVO